MANLRCSCGQDLHEWRYTAPSGKPTGVWCVGLADLIDYQTHRMTRHDVYDLQDRRVRRGLCMSQALDRGMYPDRPDR
jgi:hypothetical protein